MTPGTTAAVESGALTVIDNSGRRSFAVVRGAQDPISLDDVFVSCLSQGGPPILSGCRSAG